MLVDQLFNSLLLTYGGSLAECYTPVKPEDYAEVYPSVALVITNRPSYRYIFDLVITTEP